MFTCNVVVPSIFWFRWPRRNVYVMWIASVLINVGMWCERFVIVVISLHRDFLPSAWALYKPTWVDLSLLFGTVCFFGTLFLLFLRFIPAVAVQEAKELRHELHKEHVLHEIPEFSQEALAITELEAGETET
jgi:molybdopterin-containing oxidoreductase family membrane subunit